MNYAGQQHTVRHTAPACCWTSAAAPRPRHWWPKLERLVGGLLFTDSGTDLGIALAAFGHGPEALDDRELVPTPWVDALRAFLAGDLAQAAATYAEIGCVPDEARCRTLLGERLLERGELECALTLWSGLGAHA